MAERLTEKNSIENKRYMLNSEDNTVCVTNARLTNCATIAYCWGKPIDKLAQLEDILEKYGIESVEELDKELSIRRLLHQTIAELSKMATKAENDRDTWKKACELACDDLGLYEDVTTTQLKMKCYYQQAKKGNDSH